MRIKTILIFALLAGCAGVDRASELPRAASQSPPLTTPDKPAQPKDPAAAETASPPADPASPVPADQPPETEAPVVSAVRYAVHPVTHQIKPVAQSGDMEKIVLLTFDDGPVEEVTPRILDVLDRHQAKAVWFVNGHQLARKQSDGSMSIDPKKAELLREIKKRGHLIGNHTWWHENLRGLPADKQREEITSTSEVIRRITGENPRYFRPPFGAYTPTSLAVCRELGMQSMNWSVGSLDWDPRVYKQPGGVTRQVLDTVHNGGNLLFHDRPWTASELDQILTGLKQKGYRFVLPTEVTLPSASPGKD